MAPSTLSVFTACLGLSSVAVGQYGNHWDRRAYGGYDYGFSVDSPLEQSTERYVLGSLPVVNGSLPPLRIEVRELEKDAEKWTLYILGLSMMQFMDQSDPLGWWEFSGIHSRPFRPWGGVEAVPGSEEYGYCHHVSTLFPTWHRPYAAMFENTLFHLIQRVASFWPDGEAKERYQAAAANFRIPYWDWATIPRDGGSVFPESFAVPFVDVDGPNGLQRIANPLFSYRFRPRDLTEFEGRPWTVWTQTIRAPTSKSAVAVSDDEEVIHSIDQALPDVQQRIYALFSNYHNFTSFGNEAWSSEMTNSSYDSLEAVHDYIHGVVGGYEGHFSFVPYSGFDPVFFLHHGMVDRILAMWQALNPDSWAIPVPAVSETYTVSVGEILDGKTPLTPFFADANGNFWDSDMARDPTIFGYTYADVAGIRLDGSPIDEESQSRVREIINHLYSQSSPLKLIEGYSAGSGAGSSYSSTGDQGSVSESSKSSEPGKSVIVDNKYHEWFANVRVSKEALGGSFFLHFFIGPVPKDSHTWLDAPNRLGATNVFSSPGGPTIGKGGHLITGTVHLTAGLVREVLESALSDLEPATVEPYLKQNLRCAAMTADRRVFDVEEIDDLQIQILSSTVSIPSCDTELPSWEEPITHFDLVQRRREDNGSGGDHY